jgi:hypothetical protein
LGRKTTIGAQQNDILFCDFPVFRAFLCRKPLSVRIFQRGGPFQKNHTKKPTVGFWCFGCYGRIFIVKVEKHTEHIEGQPVASLPLDGSPHRLIRAIHVIRGSLQKWDHGLHRFHGLAARSGPSNLGKPNAFLKLRALRAFRGETPLRLRPSWMTMIRLMQVVDFHDIFTYFSWFWWRPFAVGDSVSGCFCIGLCKSLIFIIFSDISHAFLRMRKTRLAQ